MKIINVASYEGLYAISDDGRFFNLKTGNEIKQTAGRGGYMFAGLWKDGIQHPVYTHRAVFYSFNKFPRLTSPDKLEIDHIDGNNKNNRLDNLRRITQRENVARAKKSKCGYRGVHLYKHINKYGAEITINQVKYHLGVFEEAEDASAAYQNALKAYEEHGILPKKRDRTKKLCKCCNRELPIEEFYKRKDSGHSYYCKECLKGYMREHRKKIREANVNNVNP